MNSHDRERNRSDEAVTDDDRAAGDIHRRATRERYAELALLVVGVLLASVGEGPLAWAGLALGGVAVLGFLYSTFRDRRIGPLAPCGSPKTPAVLAALLVALAVLQDPPQRWVFLSFSVALVFNAVQAAVPRTMVRKVLDAAIVAAVAAGLAVIVVFP